MNNKVIVTLVRNGAHHWTSGTSYFKKLLTVPFTLVVFSKIHEVLMLLIPSPFKFAVSVLKELKGTVQFF
jgi:hypothetical protein